MARQCVNELGGRILKMFRRALAKDGKRELFSRVANEDPVDICASVWMKAFSGTAQSHFPKLSGYLHKLELWVLAYQRSSAHYTGSFPSRSSIPLSTLRSIISLRDAVFYNRFRWHDRYRLLLYPPNHTPSLCKRISPDPSFQDRVVQELLLLILEPLFESRFSPKSHAFRPGRNAHTLLRTLRGSFAGYLWFLKGDASQILRSIDVDLTMSCFKQVIGDRRILNLVRSAILAQRPVVDNSDAQGKKGRKKATKKKILNPNEPKPDPYWLRIFFGFAPEEASSIPDYGSCGILSPLLLNICLNELDQMMERRIPEFFKPNKNDSVWRESINDGNHNPLWPEFVPSSGREKTRRMDYVRHGSHFLVGIRGPRNDAEEIRREMIDFCESKIGIKLDHSTVEISHISRGVEFLDHIICRRVVHPTLRYTGKGGKVVSEKGVGTVMSITANLTECVAKFRKLNLVKGDIDPDPQPCLPMLYSGQAHTNSQMNKFLETMADWYRYADNRKKVVGLCAFVIRSSLAKLYAARYRLKSRAKVYKIASRDLSFPLRESSNNAAPEYRDLVRMGAVDTIEGIQFARTGYIPGCDYSPLPRDWAPHHERLLRAHAIMDDPKLFSHLYKDARDGTLCSPHLNLQSIVWNFKTMGITTF